MRECLLPLAEQHASLGLAQSLQVEGTAISKAETNPGMQHASVPVRKPLLYSLALDKWRATALLLHGGSGKGMETHDYWAARENYWVLVGGQQSTTAEL